MGAFADALAVIYADPNLGTAAVLTVGSPAGAYPIAALDLTEGVRVDLGGVGVDTLMPAAAVRNVLLAEAGLAADDLDGATLTLGGADWRIAAVRPKPNPEGEAAGETLLFLEAI